MKTYECLGCGHRVEADAAPERCPRCGDNVADNGGQRMGEEFIPYPVFTEVPA